MSNKIQPSKIAAGLLGALAVCAGTESAQGQAAPVVSLKTATMIVKDVPNAPNAKPKRLEGAGVMDSKMMADDTGRMFFTWTDSPKPGQANSVQGAIAVVDLTETGLQMVTPPKALPALKGERTHMRPLPALGTNFMVDIFASEDQGNNNNNPQAVAWVFDRTGTALPILNNTRQDAAKPTNLITLGGEQDLQQWGPHSICSLGADGAGESFLVGMQRNNQTAWVMKVKVEMQAGGAKVTVPYLTKVLNNARHNRPQVECPVPGTVTRTTRVITSVEANNQPSDIGVRAILFDTLTGKVVNSKLIAASDKKAKIYAVQPTVAAISNDVVAIQWQQSAPVRAKTDGHGGAENLSKLTTLRVSTDAAQAFAKLDEITADAPYQRHAEAMGTLFGPGAGKPAVAVMAGSSTGTGKGLVQMIPVDPTTGKISAVDRIRNLFNVSTFADVAQLPAIAKRNPNDQARGFFNGINGLKNPGFGKPNGFMSDVSTFNASAVAGFKDITSNRDSLLLALAPATWLDGLVGKPGVVTNAAEIPLGPAPRETPSASDSPSASNDPFSSTDDDSARAGGNDGYSRSSADAGCSVSTRAPATSGLGMMAGFVAGLALLVVRRRKGH